LEFYGYGYGWTPPPAKIPKTEYERLIPHSSPDEKTMIEKWYKHDENLRILNIKRKKKKNYSSKILFDYFIFY